MFGCALGCAIFTELLFTATIPRNGRPKMLRDLILDLLTAEIKKEFSNIFSDNWPNVTVNDASNSMQAITPAPVARDINTMVDDLRPLFFSRNEQRVLDYLTREGATKQDAVIAYFKAAPDSINEASIKFLLSNLKHRRALTTVNDGYAVVSGL